MNLVDMLEWDFNFVLNIAGGFGYTRNEPVVILDLDVDDASLTQMQVLKGIGMGKGILWRILARNAIVIDQANVEQILIETIQLTESEVITQQEYFYFDVTMANPQGKVLPDVVVFKESNTKINFPYELSWLHYSGFRDYEADAAGLGQSVSYNALGIKATIYIYDNLHTDIPDGIDSLVIKKEFENAISDLISTHAEIATTGEVSKSDKLILQVFKVDGSFSLIGLGALGGKFVKVRITHDQDPVLIEITSQFIDTFEMLLASVVVH